MASFDLDMICRSLCPRIDSWNWGATLHCVKSISGPLWPHFSSLSGIHWRSWIRYHLYFTWTPAGSCVTPTLGSWYSVWWMKTARCTFKYPLTLSSRDNVQSAHASHSRNLRARSLHPPPRNALASPQGRHYRPLSQAAHTLSATLNPKSGEVNNPNLNTRVAHAAPTPTRDPRYAYHVRARENAIAAPQSMY